MEYDFLIIGQGIAGSLLGYRLIVAGKSCLVVDPCDPFTSSTVASGLIHPITGRRMAKSWNADEFIPAARKCYPEIEEKLGESFFRDFPMLEVFHDVRHQNEWTSRSEDPGFSAYLGKTCSSSEIPPGYVAPLGGQWVINGGRLDCKRFVLALRKYFESSGSFHQGRVAFTEIKKTENTYHWNGISSKTIIDCRGYEAGIEGPLKQLPFNPAKGEIIHFQASGLAEDVVVHNGLKVIPLGNGHFLSGASYSWHVLDSIPDPKSVAILREKLEKILCVEIREISAVAGVRPSTKSRRPFIGHLDSDATYYYFNGLGSKGVMMGPLLSQILCDHLCNGDAIPEKYQVLSETDQSV